MQEYSIGPYRMEICREATGRWYRQYSGWGCNCGHCRNFMKLAVQRKLPPYIHQILEELSVSPEKATYVCELFTDGEGIHYQFSYRLAGFVVNLPETEGGEYGGQVRCCHEPYPYGAPDFPAPHFDLEFYAVLPWVLEET